MPKDQWNKSTVPYAPLRIDEVEKGNHFVGKSERLRFFSISGLRFATFFFFFPDVVNLGEG